MDGITIFLILIALILFIISVILGFMLTITQGELKTCKSDLEYSRRS